MNSAGGTRPRAGCCQRSKCFGTREVTLVIDLRLVVEHELLLANALAQIRLESGTRRNPGLHLRVEETQGVAARGLGLVHGQIGPFQQFVDCLPGAHERA
jgi:hypothetical protein